MAFQDYTPATYASGIAHEKLGPAMNALNPRQRAVVDYLLTTGSDSWADACRASGYEDGPGLFVTASRLKHDPRMGEAIIEEGRRRIAHDLPMAIGAVRSIAANPQHKDQLRAAIHIQAQVGLGATSKVEHLHTHTGDLMDRARAAAERLGIDFADPNWRDGIKAKVLEHQKALPTKYPWE